MARFEHFQKLNQLKAIERVTKVNRRPESPAEHTWACLLYAEYFLKIVSVPLQADRVRTLLLYHDLVEIEAGDVPELDEGRREAAVLKERNAFMRVRNSLPEALHEEYTRAFHEFERQETLEAQFACALDKLEPMIHQLDHKSDWKRYGYTAQVLWDKKGRFMQPFPELLEFYTQLIAYLKAQAYIDDA
jgi:putative hydrolases of HD superfamily